MHILQVVIKNTSTLDFTAPVLVELKRRMPDVRVTILYCVLDRRNILRQSKFYESIFAEHEVRQIDFLNFLRPLWRPVEGLLRRIFSGANADKVHLHEAYEFYCLNHRTKSRIGFMIYLLREYRLGGVTTSVMQSMATLAEKYLTVIFVKTTSILDKISPDLVLFDNRSVTQFPGRDNFYAWMYQHKVNVALLPHAPHLRDPVKEFCAFDENGESLPDFCEFWVPLRFGEPWRQLPDKRAQFQVTGYPGLDSAWLEWCIRKEGEFKPVIKSGRKIRCLFVMRRYMPKGVVRPPKLDPYIVDYEDVFDTLMALGRSFKDLRCDIELILKPHPANNYSVLASDMQYSGFSDWRISHESIYALLPEVDVVVGLFSTVLLVPAMAGIPTLLVKTRLQDVVHSEWSLLEEMYTNMKYYVPTLDGLTAVVENALSNIGSGHDAENLAHLRYYFPDNAVENILDNLTKKSNPLK